MHSSIDQFNQLIRVVAIIPCFNANLKTLKSIVERLIEVVDFVVVVDDACPNCAGDYIDLQFKNQPVQVIWNQEIWELVVQPKAINTYYLN